MALPPLHRVDHEPTYILSFDSAWDQDRLEAEFAAIADPKKSSPWAKKGDHPCVRFIQGESRGDLATVAQWLKPDGNPVKFRFRRLNLREMAIVEARQQTSLPAGRNLALAYALVDIEGAEVSLTRGGRDLPHPLTDDDLQRVRELVGDDGLAELGAQAIACSRELLESEKKP